mgnify:CR=1 FL=1
MMYGNSYTGEGGKRRKRGEGREGGGEGRRRRGRRDGGTEVCNVTGRGRRTFTENPCYETRRGEEEIFRSTRKEDLRFTRGEDV